MPELPEVELFKRRAADPCRGRVISKAVVSDPGIVEGISGKALEKRLSGERLGSARRYGKNLFIELSGGGALAMHFGMNGSLALLSKDEPDPPYTRLQLHLDKGARLAYVNPRRIGRVSLAKGEAAFVEEAGLGPDVLDATFKPEAFSAILATGKRDIKSVLMDQELMAGIGNIYSDEILFQARIYPGIPAAKLRRDQAGQLFRAMRKTLEAAVESGAGSEQGIERLPKGFLIPQRRRGGRCPRCGSAIAAIKHGGRTCYYCPRCQPK